MGSNKLHRQSNSHDNIDLLKKDPQGSARKYHSLWETVAKITTNQTDQIKEIKAVLTKGKQRHENM